MKKSQAIFILILTAMIMSCRNSNTYQGELITFESRWGEVFQDSIPITKESVMLGKQLFFDKRLSKNQTVSCATCHHPEKAFTDGKKVSEGLHQRTTMRNAPTLYNVGFHPYFMLDGGVKTLEMQLLVPLLDTSEMGNDLPELINRLSKVTLYDSLSRIAFQRPFDIFVLTRSIAHFQRSLISQNSPFDYWYYDNDANAITKDARNGWKLFDEVLNCTNCHQLPAFTDYSFQRSPVNIESTDPGRFRISRDSLDFQKFKVPTLRNIALTAPYFHNGSVNSLAEVINAYLNVYENELMEEAQNAPTRALYVKQLTAFFKSLTDTSSVTALPN